MWPVVKDILFYFIFFGTNQDMGQIYLQADSGSIAVRQGGGSLRTAADSSSDPTD